LKDAVEGRKETLGGTLKKTPWLLIQGFLQQKLAKYNEGGDEFREGMKKQQKKAEINGRVLSQSGMRLII